MPKLRIFHICLTLALLGQALGVDYSNPKSQVEYISQQPTNKPVVMPITRPPLLNLTPPPPPGDSKNFAYNPITNTWTRVAGHDPQPEEGVLIWNQANDKWLTHVPHV